MHRCTVKGTLLMGKKTRREQSEELSCAICRVLFCCERDRGEHEDTVHAFEDVLAARQRRLMLKETKPLICTVCCQVFYSGLFAGGACNNNSRQSYAGSEKSTRSVHVLIIIPEWAANKHLVPAQRKRSWDKANHEVVEHNIVVAVNRAEDVRPQDNSFIIQKRSIQGILSKQRKTDLSVDRPARRVTFSPVAAVAFASQSNLFQGPRPAPVPLLKYSSPSSPQSDILTSPASTVESPLDPTVPILSPQNEQNGCPVFSPPSDDNNGSPMLSPQMSSTPYCDSSGDRRMDRISSVNEAEQDVEPNEGGGIFSSLASVICCAVQVIPSVVSYLFSLNSDNNPQEREGFLPRRPRRRRSATFTPYVPMPYRERHAQNKSRREFFRRPAVKLCRTPAKLS